MKLLLAEDEQSLSRAIAKILEKNHYTVETVYNGEDALAYLELGSYDAVILDIMMPKLDGITVLKRLRAMGNSVPVLLLTAKAEIDDKVLGLDSGANDYLTKPFNILELKARVRALLRRASISAPPVQPSSAVLSRGHITVDEERRKVTKSGEVIELTMKEFDLILFLMKNPGRVYSRENLLDLVWGYDYQGDTRTVDVHIRRLREKLELDSAKPRYIVTKWGVGYYFAE